MLTGPSSTPTGVGRTALLAAAMRAAETRREDRLFSDPYADGFLAAGGADEFTSESTQPTGDFAQLRATFANYAPIRTRFFDEYLLDATEDIRQVVIIAAGLDTRAFRLPWSTGVTVYELDTAEVLAFKQQVLDSRTAQSSAHRVPVAVDLREEWTPSLIDAGFDAAALSAWLVEGLVSYLSPEQNDRLLATISAEAAPGSRLSIEYVHVDTAALMTRALADASGAEMKSMWNRGGVAEPYQPWLKRHGWDSKAYDTYERASAYRREMPPLGDTPIDRYAAAARKSLVIARRR